MTEHRLVRESVFVSPTPGGAYYAASSPEWTPARLLLFRLMAGNETPAVTLPTLLSWTGSNSEQEVLELLSRMQSLAWIQAEERPRRLPEGMLDEILPSLLVRPFYGRRVLLADSGGFAVANRHFAQETAEELAALSADLASLYERHQGLLLNTMGLTSGALGLIDAAGNSQLGFWPLYIGAVRFVLVVSGLPLLNDAGFTDLVWALARRYAILPERIDLHGVDTTDGTNAPGPNLG